MVPEGSTMKVRRSPPEAEALPQRKAMVRHQDTMRGVVFQAIERELTRAAGPGAVAEVRTKAGLRHTHFDAMSKFPLMDFITYQEAAAEKLAPLVGGYDEAVWKMGGAAAEAFFDSIAGRTMALLAGRDPTQLLNAVPAGYTLLVSYGRRSWRQTKANEGHFSFEDEYLGPIHNLGTFDSALRVVHGVDPTFELEQQSPLNFTFVVRW
jgi:uncharacterized protein (TIGR02265 family)